MSEHRLLDRSSSPDAPARPPTSTPLCCHRSAAWVLFSHATAKLALMLAKIFGSENAGDVSAEELELERLSTDTLQRTSETMAQQLAQRAEAAGVTTARLALGMQYGMTDDQVPNLMGVSDDEFLLLCLANVSGSEIEELRARGSEWLEAARRAVAVLHLHGVGNKSPEMKSVFACVSAAEVKDAADEVLLECRCVTLSVTVTVDDDDETQAYTVPRPASDLFRQLCVEGPVAVQSKVEREEYFSDCRQLAEALVDLDVPGRNAGGFHFSVERGVKALAAMLLMLADADGVLTWKSVKERVAADAGAVGDEAISRFWYRMGSQGLGAQDFFLGHFPIIKATALASQEDTSGAGEPVAKRARKPSAKQLALEEQLALERPSVRMESVAATALGRRFAERLQQQQQQQQQRAPPRPASAASVRSGPAGGGGGAPPSVGMAGPPARLPAGTADAPTPISLPLAPPQASVSGAPFPHPVLGAAGGGAAALPDPQALPGWMPLPAPAPHFPPFGPSGLSWPVHPAPALPGPARPHAVDYDEHAASETLRDLAFASARGVPEASTSDDPSAAHKHATRRNRALAPARAAEQAAQQLGGRPRLRWSPQLHERFAEAVSILGGADLATPRQILNIMISRGQEGLTIGHIKVRAPRPAPAPARAVADRHSRTHPGPPTAASPRPCRPPHPPPPPPQSHLQKVRQEGNAQSLVARPAKKSDARESSSVGGEGEAPEGGASASGGDPPGDAEPRGRKRRERPTGGEEPASGEDGDGSGKRAREEEDRRAGDDSPQREKRTEDDATATADYPTRYSPAPDRGD